MGFQRDEIPLVGYGAKPHRPPIKKPKQNSEAHFAANKTLINSLRAEQTKHNSKAYF